MNKSGVFPFFNQSGADDKNQDSTLDNIKFLTLFVRYLLLPTAGKRSTLSNISFIVRSDPICNGFSFACTRSKLKILKIRYHKTNKTMVTTWLKNEKCYTAKLKGNIFSKVCVFCQVNFFLIKNINK